MSEIIFIHGSLSSGKGKIYSNIVKTNKEKGVEILAEFIGSLDAAELYGGIDKVVTLDHVLERAAHCYTMAQEYEVGVLTGFGCSRYSKEIVEAYPNAKHIFLKHVNDAFSSLPQILQRVQDTNTFTTEQMEFIYDIHLETKSSIEKFIEEKNLKWLPFNKRSIGEDGLPYETFEDSYSMMFCVLDSTTVDSIEAEAS